ncbi:tripartite tricarboxylate transporter substrate binding protein [Pigmentiphaga soli]|uniref:Tripartite tricarboxylate transporter substrate binding protein n=1 Tax=Pigmentiphaga soli TaxID=1007095 RepID=A0ABP8H966_9BURK
MHPRSHSSAGRGALPAVRPGRVAAALLLAAGSAAHAAFPDRPLTLVVPFAPGGANDVIARIVSQNLGSELGQPVIIDNRPGAGGTLGTEMVAKAAPDGYTLLMMSVTHATSASMYAKLAYDPVNDFAGVSQLTRTGYVMVVSAASPLHTLGELIAQCRARPGQLNYASSGKGSPPHLAGALFANMAGLQLTHIPYRGGAPALVDVVRGEVLFYFSSVSGAVPQVRAGKVRPLAVSGATRSPAFPDVPTVAEAGLPGFDIGGWYGIAAPAGTPRPVIGRLNAAIAATLARPGVRRQLADHGEEAVASKPDDFQRYIAAEIKHYARIVGVAGVTPE